MEIIASSKRSTKPGPATWFTGQVWVDEIVSGVAPSNLRCGRVHFSPGARTAWHTHPRGQTIHVLSGVGLVQSKGQPVQNIQPGDTVIFAPGEVHWHGAAPEHFMIHLAMQESDETGSAVTWMEQVSDAEYSGK